MKKYKNILFVVFALAVILLAVYFVSLFGGETVGSGNQDAFSLSSADFEVVSCSLDGKSGISEGDALEIAFNQPVPLATADNVDISPAVKGEWSVIDNRLIFHPSVRWKAGTLYTVTLNGSADIRYLERSLKKDVAYFFETQDSALRIPANATFRMDTQQYFFHPSEEIVLEAGYTDVNGASETDATVKVWKCNEDKDYIRKFSELFAIPQWASITRNKTLVDTSGLTFLGKTDTRIVDGKITYPGLESGKYLLRVVVGGAAIDVAVTIDDMDVYSCFDGQNIDLWVHENSEVLNGAKVRNDTVVEYLDDTGGGKIPYHYSQAERLENPKSGVLEIVSKKTTHIIFLDETILNTPAYHGVILCDKALIEKGETLNFYGNLTPAGTTATMPKEVAISLQNASGSVAETTISLEDSDSFSGSFEELSLPKGEYKLQLKAGDNLIGESSFFAVSDAADWGRLLVTQSDTTAYFGQSVTFRVQAVNKNGAPMKGLPITSSEGTTVYTDANGDAWFSLASETNGLGAMTKTIDFQGTLLSQGTIEATAQYTVVNRGDAVYEIADGQVVKKPQEEAVTPQDDTASEGKETRYFVSDGEGFSLYETAQENSAFAVVYENGVYSVDRKAGEDSLAMVLPETLSVAAGEPLSFSAVVTGGRNVYTTAELFAGQVPAAILGNTIKNQPGEVMMWSNAVASLGSKSNAFTFSTQGLSGHYFLRVRAESQSGESICSYLPVFVGDGATLVCDISKYYKENTEIEIPFRCDGGDVSYQVVVDNKSVATGRAEKENTAMIGSYAVGTHEATISLWNGNTIVEQQDFSFLVYCEEPDFMAATTKAAEEPLLSYDLDEGTEAYVKKLFDLNLFPGNQLIEVLGRNHFFGDLKSNSDFLSTYVDKDFNVYQNADGSFSRVVGGSGDVLLSCFVAGNEDADFDRESLKTFFKRKMSHTSDMEVLALSYWGLSLLGEAPLEEMTYHIEDKSFSPNAMLYLAEAFYSNGDTSTANRIFLSVTKSLKKSDDQYYYKDPERNQSIFTALLTFDLSQKFNSKYSQGLLNYLMEAKLETQSNRFLMTLNLLNYVDIGGITLTSDPKNADLNIVGVTPKDMDMVKSTLLVNGESVSAVSVNDMVELTLDWSSSAKKNLLYMVYFTPKQDISLVEDTNTALYHGRVMKLTMDTATSLHFSPSAIGSDVIGDVYILNVTSGEVLAKVELEDLAVVE